MDFEYTIVRADIGIDIKRLTDKARFMLESQIMNDMKPYMPIRTGSLIQRTSAETASMHGSGLISAAAPPYGRFQYFGKVMVDPETGSPWARKGAKKVLTDRPLRYSNPAATPEWFETAKKNHLKEWIDLVNKAVNDDA